MRVALAVLAAVPTLALAQVGALNAAREAGAKQQAGTAAHMKAADAQFAEGAEPVAADAPAAQAAPADDSVNLNAAASRLEREVGALPGTEVAVSPGAPSSEAHKVVRGDTLWDLSAKFLKDPFAWPKIWSWNPEIANPHWIYPGNNVRLGPAGGAVEAQAQAPVAEAPADDSDLAQSPKEIASFSVGSLDRPQELGDGDEVMVVGSRKIGYVAPSGTRTRRDSFVTPTELAQSGAISAAFEDKLLLTTHDRAYATFAGDPAKPGQIYAIFRTERELRHPVDGKPFGYKTTILGAGRVVAVDGQQATVDITSAAEAIERGDRLGLLPSKPLAEVARRPNQRNVAGVIVAADVEVISEIGQHHYVYVDRGSADGVEPGNVFTVVRSGDPYGRDMTAARQDPNLPREQVGSLLVVEAKEHASTALVVKSERELLIGDQVEMRAARSAGVSSN
jgi:hypothetical protein